MADVDADRLALVTAVAWVVDEVGYLRTPDRDALADIAEGLAPGHVTAAVVADAQQRVPQVLAAVKAHLKTLTNQTPDTPEEARRG